MPRFDETIYDLCRRQVLLTTRQLGVLLACQSAVEDARLVRSIAGLLCQAKPIVTRAADALESLGYVKRVRLATDRRLVRLDLTAKGRKVVGELVG